MVLERSVPNMAQAQSGDLTHESPSPTANTEKFVIVPKRRITSRLHPYTRPLTTSDLESVVALENIAFSDPGERATREKLLYRLTKCGELCLGIFCTIVPGQGLGSSKEVDTLSTGRLVETSRRNGAVSALLGHIISSKTSDLSATDQSMAYPEDWRDDKPNPSRAGHQEEGRTIVLHSVAMLPNFQGRGLGQVLVKAYIQQISGAGIADRLVLIAHDHMISWYEKHGFVNKGKSDVKFGHGEWFDMVLEIRALEAAPYG